MERRSGGRGDRTISGAALSAGAARLAAHVSSVHDRISRAWPVGSSRDSSCASGVRYFFDFCDADCDGYLGPEDCVVLVVGEETDETPGPAQQGRHTNGLSQWPSLLHAH